MEFEFHDPEEEGPGYWKGYYNGLAFIFFMVVFILNGGLWTRAFYRHGFTGGLEKLMEDYSFSNWKFYTINIILILLGLFMRHIAKPHKKKK
ncbi:MAG: hypothetical protein HOI80_00965 [Alphaproteobacteria bacterium]|jgi:hypothetical protein|nr:hypothetical protein [Alphaproteobacteria bacterium]MBT5390670.1 hypothetical protein [Alphaproteobacteria bacterium]MBT5540262.1 hypothetical protein [Alphaproteobacteria bacterium]MBT5654058.1 hypothetical protein [Alphaproteobacteria bacterium]